MIIEQIYTGCLAQGAYYIESDGEVAIIDPLREVHSYQNKAKKHGAKIKYIFESLGHTNSDKNHILIIIYSSYLKVQVDCIDLRSRGGMTYLKF
jgi:hypothetical protein